MRAYIIRRLLLIIPTLFILSILVFLSVRFIPGDVIDVIVGRMGMFNVQWDVDREALERMLGLDVPVLRAVWTMDRRYFPARQPWRIPVYEKLGGGGDIRETAGHH